MTKITITQELVQHLFEYKDGALYYKNKTSKYNTKPIGSIAGYLRPFDNCVRRIIKVHNTDYIAARLIFFYHEGWFPEMVDHENRDTLDDRIENLRAAKRHENAKNSSSRKGSTSKYLGVCWDKRLGKWSSDIWIFGKTVNLGKYILESEAALAYNREAVRYHKEFANLNICK